MTDPSTTPTGSWAPIYAERLHHIADLATLNWGEDATGAEAAWTAPFGEPEPTAAHAEDREIPGPHGPIPVRIYRPVSGEPSGAGLVWYHGGAFLGGDLDMPEADLVARGLVTRTAGVVVSVFYRLCVDGVHHPVPHDDAYTAYRWTRDHAAELGIDPGRLAVGGASAGGCLAATVALHGRDDGFAPAKALLAYPVCHAAMPPGSEEYGTVMAQLPPALGFPPEATAALNWNYVGSDPATADGYAFPGHATELGGFPSAYIENCEFDELRASGEEFGRQLASVGVDVEVVTAAGVPHGHLNAIGSPLTAATLDRFAARMP
jgi:xylan 1,4-beta-xylosidase